MAGMPGSLVQGWLGIQVGEKFSNNPDYDDLLSKLRNKSRPITAFFYDIGILKRGHPPHDAITKHLNDHWFNDGPTGYWPHNGAKAEIVRNGYIKALELAKTTQLPVAILWVCAGNCFQVAIARTPSQITLLMLTPDVPNAVPQPATTEIDDAWIIGTEHDIDMVVREAVNFGGLPKKSDCTLLDGAAGVWEAPLYRPPSPPTP